MRLHFRFWSDFFLFWPAEQHGMRERIKQKHEICCDGYHAYILII